MSYLYQSLSFALKLPIVTGTHGLFLTIFPRLIQSSVKKTKNHLQFDLVICKVQQKGKVYNLFLTPSLCIRLRAVYQKLENFLTSMLVVR